MNKLKMKVFLVLEAALFLLTLYQIFRSYDLLLIVIAGVLILKISSHNKQRTAVLRWIGWFMIILSLLSIFTVWIMFAIALLFLILQGSSMMQELSIDSFMDVPWRKKSYLGIVTKEPEERSGTRTKQTWLGNKTIGSNVYEWNDINLSILIGDTIIDLGNTLLPDEENVILIRKGAGQTRVIVPKGVGVMIHHSVLQGNLLFKGEIYPLSNETMTLYSQDYHSATRKIKIVSNTLLGDFEVIYL